MVQRSGTERRIAEPDCGAGSTRREPAHARASQSKILTSAIRIFIPAIEMNMDEQLRIDALEYHRQPRPGKISVTPTKGLINQRDLALAYSPGVAAACDAILPDPQEARSRTSRAPPVAV